MNRLKRIFIKGSQPRAGFTLIEMVVVLGIIALLMLIIIPNLNHRRELAADKSDRALVQVVHNQAAMYANDQNEDLKQVTLDDLRKAQYLNSSQYERAKANHVDPSQAEDADVSQP